MNNKVMNDMINDVDELHHKVLCMFANIRWLRTPHSYIVETIQELRTRLYYIKEYIIENDMSIRICENGKTATVNCFFDVVNVVFEFTDKEEKRFFEMIFQMIDNIFLFQYDRDRNETYIRFHTDERTRALQIAVIIDLMGRYTK